MASLKRNCFRYLSVAACLSITTGCAVSLRDHTAHEFPSDLRDRRPASQTLYTGSTPQEVVEASADFKHKFLLEVKPKNVSNIRAFVNVDGQEHAMSEHDGSTGKGLFVYAPETPDCSKDAYQYYYRVRYNAGAYGAKTKYLKDDNDQPFEALVLGSGRYVWWSSRSYAVTGNGSISMRATMDGEGKRTRLYIQSLTQSPMRVSFIGLSSSGDTEKFALENMPSSRELRCQDFLTFDLVWTPVPPDFEDSIRLAFEVEFDMGGGNWVDDTAPVIINITTGEYMPPP